MKINYQIILLILLLMAIFLAASDTNRNKLGPRLEKRLQEQGGPTSELVWIYFKDKGNSAWQNSVSARGRLSEKALKRRAKVNAVMDERDFPVNAGYLQALADKGFGARNVSSWLNAASGHASLEQIDELVKLDCVERIELVGRFKRNKDFPETASEEIHAPLNKNSSTSQFDPAFYGTSYTQVNQIHVPEVHQHGIFGQGVIIAVLDNGFRLLTHEAFDSMTIIATKDFVDHKISVVPNNPDPAYGSHGINTLSTIGGYVPTQLIGPAFRAHFILGRTENDSSETPVEEDNWIAGMQWADSLGADIISSSLGYLGFDNLSYYDWTWMNGDSTVVTRGANIGVSMGLVIVNSAGNEGFNGSHNTLIGPADGDSVIAVGAVTSTGTKASFSSNGPTTRGKIKPDVVAMGQGVRAASATSTTGFVSVSGTSFSCPLTAGVCALILSAHPNLTPAQVRWALTHTADRASNPDNQYGYGIINALAAIGAPAAPQILSATPDSGQIILKWSKSQAAKFLRYRIYSGLSSGPTAVLDSVGLQNDTVRIFSGLTSSTTYFYRITVIDSNHFESAFSNEVSAVPLPGSTGAVLEFALKQNYPNPFNPGTQIKYEVFKAGNVKIVVYNSLGQRVKTLVNSFHGVANTYVASWDGKDESGSAVSSGVYFYRMTANGFSKTKRMLLLR